MKKSTTIILIIMDIIIMSWLASCTKHIEGINEPARIQTQIVCVKFEKVMYVTQSPSGLIDTVYFNRCIESKLDTLK